MLEWPTVFHTTAGGEDRPQCILQAVAIARALVYLDVRERTEKSAAPVGASQGVCPIEALVPRLRQAFGETFHQVVPYISGLKVSHFYSGNRLHIGSDPLLNPVMLASNRRKRQMNHFVRHDPVALEVLLSCELTDEYGCRGASLTLSSSAQHAPLSLDRHN